MRVKTTINGKSREFECDPGACLLDVLGANGYKSVKQGCDNEGMCGVCTVLIDGEPFLSCITPAAKVEGRQVTTVEGLGDPAKPHAIQTAFVEAGAVQCGFCSPGMILTTKSLLDKTKNPSEAEIADALSGNLCRCTGYVKIVEAVKDAAKAIQRGDQR